MLSQILLSFASVYSDAGLPNANTDNLVSNVKNLVFVVATVLALYFLVMAGFKYVTSSGSSDKTKEATQTIIFASLGLFIILMSYTIITWVFKIGTAK